jgi:hypothetical protein
MARAKMKEAGWSKPNKRMATNWRKITGAYPVSLITGKRMTAGYSGKKRGKGHWRDLFCYSLKEV